MALNYRLSVYFSLLDDPMSAGTDAFLQWDGLHAYAFPPFALIRRILNMLLDRKGTHLALIAFFWPQKEWFPDSRVWLWLQCPFHLGEIFSDSHISITCTRNSLCFTFMFDNYTAIRLQFRSLDGSPRSFLFAAGNLHSVCVNTIGSVIGHGALIGDTPSLLLWLRLLNFCFLFGWINTSPFLPSRVIVPLLLQFLKSFMTAVCCWISFGLLSWSALAILFALCLGTW